MDEEEEMLRELGISDVDELFADVPEKVRHDIDIPEGISEMEVINEVKSKLDKNTSLDEIANFAGGGIYRHFVPSSVFEIIGRSEFYTSYTPYQAEISQGMLQSLFEYQSLICELTGMEAANTSMYDYPTAFAEAVLMSARVGKRKRNRFLIPENIHWEKWSILDNYLRGTDIEIEKVRYDEDKGTIDEEDLKNKMNDETLGFYVESPNAFGVLEENIDLYKDLKEDHRSILVVGSNPIALSLMKPPSEWGADIVIGDSQPLGIPTSLGGPTVGIFACKKRHIRRMPGRMIGETEDQDGRTAYCMTLQTREQHIRRERATSNICTNQALMALASASYLFLKGGKGLEELAKENYHQAHELAQHIDKIEGFESPYFDGEFFNEFFVKIPVDDVQGLVKRAMDKKVLPGVGVGEGTGRLERSPSGLLVSTTETNTKKDKEKLIEVLKEVAE